jgi:hypothetical protein
MTYDQFLGARRALMAQLVRAAFERLSDSDYTPVVTSQHPVSDDDLVGGRTTLDLFAAGVLNAGGLLAPADSSEESGAFRHRRTG